LALGLLIAHQRIAQLAKSVLSDAIFSIGACKPEISMTVI
jgi:hypothetical protein